MYFFFCKIERLFRQKQKIFYKISLYIYMETKNNERLLQHSLFLLYARFSFNHSVIASNFETSKRLFSHTFKLFKLFTISNSFDFILFASINLQYPSVTVFKFL
ncbi:hypothetical protein bcere0019_21710 [Bacillus cereus Rock3-28]|nr:hypothetical protein bcere0019_21710 [Bacillus cereus Rock3-28]